MADDETTAPEFVNLRTNKRLGGWARFFVAIPATLLSLTGIGAVYLTDNEIGAAALIVMGGLFGSVTVLGHWPRLRVGDSEFDPTVLEHVQQAGVRQGAQEMAIRVYADEVASGDALVDAESAALDGPSPEANRVRDLQEEIERSRREVAGQKRLIELLMTADRIAPGSRTPNMIARWSGIDQARYGLTERDLQRRIELLTEQRADEKDPVRQARLDRLIENDSECLRILRPTPTGD